MEKIIAWNQKKKLSQPLSPNQYILKPRCKICQSPWHYRGSCPQRQIKPRKAIYKSERTKPRPGTKSPLERPTLAYKGKSERSQLIGWADKFFSLYIRTRGGDGMYNSCYTCKRRFKITELQCGHYMRRDYFMTRWNEMNCNPQCNECNVEKHGNLEIYRALLVIDYGLTAVEGLEQLARRSGKITIMDIQEVIDKYKGVVF